MFLNRFTPERIERNSNRFNTFYGGLEPQVTNTVFVYGQHDPWNIIGRTTNLNEKTISIVIAGKLVLRKVLNNVKLRQLKWAVAQKIVFEMLRNMKRYDLT